MGLRTFRYFLGLVGSSLFFFFFGFGFSLGGSPWLGTNYCFRYRLVILALVAGLPNATINGFGVSYTIFRALYFLAYSFTSSRKFVFLRPICYAGAMMSCFSVIYWSGQVFNSV